VIRLSGCRGRTPCCGTSEELPYLAPELQLLFKSENNRTKDDRDATEVIPALATGRQRRLRGMLPGEHSWQALLAT
jgi:hypothetical protein